MSDTFSKVEVIRASHVGRLPKRRGRPPAPDDTLLVDIKAVIADMPSYDYARVWAVLRRRAHAGGHAPVNRKRVYRVMRVHGHLLHRHAGGREQRRRDGKTAVAQSNLRWCSDGFEIACDNDEKVRVAFALDCCDREAIGHVATTEGIKGEDVRDLMVAAVEQRFGSVNRLPSDIEWLTDNVLRAEGKGETVKISLFVSMLSPQDARQVAWSNQAASTGKGKGLVHSKHRVRTKAALTVLNTSF